MNIIEECIYRFLDWLIKRIPECLDDEESE